jgi:hypothetical protein
VIGGPVSAAGYWIGGEWGLTIAAGVVVAVLLVLWDLANAQ